MSSQVSVRPKLSVKAGHSPDAVVAVLLPVWSSPPPQATSSMDAAISAVVRHPTLAARVAVWAGGGPCVDGWTGSGQVDMVSGVCGLRFRLC